MARRVATWQDRKENADSVLWIAFVALVLASFSWPFVVWANRWWDYPIDAAWLALVWVVGKNWVLPGARERGLNAEARKLEKAREHAAEVRRRADFLAKCDAPGQRNA